MSNVPGSTSTWLGGSKIRATAQTPSEVSGLGLGVRKTDREDLKANDKKGYYKVRDSAIEGMTNKFSILKGIDEKATMEHLESVYSVITRFEDLKTQIIAHDLGDVFSVPSTFEKNATTGDSSDPKKKSGQNPKKSKF